MSWPSKGHMFLVKLLIWPDNQREES
jgi:hypothetical protein